MVRGRLRSLVNIVLVAGVESSMLRRVAVVGACVLGAGLFATSLALAEDLNPDQARAFVVGRMFSYIGFEGTAGTGRIFAALPAGTTGVEGTSMCAHLPGLIITPCFRVQKLSHRSFRGSVSGLGFAK